jgi:hypothetical protein
MRLRAHELDQEHQLKHVAGVAVASRSPIHLATMTYRDDHDHQAFMLQKADSSVVANPIRPKTRLVVAQRLSELTWIAARGDAQLEMIGDAPPN